MDGQKILVSKIIKGGHGRKINSELGYSSFEIAADAIEMTLDPPIDISTEAGRVAYATIYQTLAKRATRDLETNIAYFRTKFKELDISLKKKDEKIESMNE